LDQKIVGILNKQKRHGFHGLTRIKYINKSVKSVKSVAFLFFVADLLNLRQDALPPTASEV
jgi:hypothetical protein